MRTTELGRTGMEITRVGLGAWAIGGAEYDWGWGDQDDDSIAAIHRALERRSSKGVYAAMRARPRSPSSASSAE